MQTNPRPFRRNRTRLVSWTLTTLTTLSTLSTLTTLVAGSATAAPQSGTTATAPATPPAAAKDQSTSKSALKSTLVAEGGFILDHDPAWFVQAAGNAAMVAPSLDGMDPEDPEFYSVNGAPLADPASLKTDEGFDAAFRSLYDPQTRFERTQPIVRHADGMLSVAMKATDREGKTRSIFIAGRVVGPNFVCVLALTSEKSMEARSKRAIAIAANIRAAGETAGGDADPKPEGAGSAPGTDAKKEAGKEAGKEAASTDGEVGKDGLVETKNDLGAYAFRHDPAWKIERDGPSTVVLAKAPAAEGELPEFYALTSIAWDKDRPLSKPENAELAARRLLASDEVQREGDIGALPGGAILFRSSVPTNDGDRLNLRVIARAEADRVVGIAILATDADVAAQETRAREIFATVRFLPMQKSEGKADPTFTGVWSTEEVLSAGGGFDAGGAATMVTERILDLGADGRFTVSVRSAGGGPGATFDAAPEIADRGTWSITREGERALLNLRSERGAVAQVPCAMFEGKLVLGGEGQRKFFNRVR